MKLYAALVSVVLMAATAAGQQPPGSVNRFDPAIYAPITPDDLRDGHDPALDAIRRLFQLSFNR